MRKIAKCFRRNLCKISKCCLCSVFKTTKENNYKPNYINPQKTQHYEKTILVTNRNAAEHRQGGIGGKREIVVKHSRASHKRNSIHIQPR